ncbi:MAG: hypothetical protein LQ340_006993 [Diploschistes diacapsis]|nr:MAG: hypothetical protein LQ340_006993 [Diploschistes diacapsis]
MPLESVKSKLKIDCNFEARWVTYFAGYVAALTLTSTRAFKIKIKEWRWSTYKKAEDLETVMRKKRGRGDLPGFSSDEHVPFRLPTFGTNERLAVKGLEREPEITDQNPQMLPNVTGPNLVLYERHAERDTQLPLADPEGDADFLQILSEKISVLNSNGDLPLLQWTDLHGLQGRSTANEIPQLFPEQFTEEDLSTTPAAFLTGWGRSYSAEG